MVPRPTPHVVSEALGSGRGGELETGPEEFGKSLQKKVTGNEDKSLQIGFGNYRLEKIHENNWCGQTLDVDQETSVLLVFRYFLAFQKRRR